MKPFLRRARNVFLAAALLTGAGAPAWAAELTFGRAAPSSGAAALSPAEQADIARIEQYLNSVKTLHAKFIQTAPDGRQAGGQFYLSRPGRMRLVYDPPVADFVVADGTFIFYWDAEMRQQSSAPIGSSLADVILRKDVKLSGDVTVKALARLPGALEATLVETADAGKGEITLIFQDKPLTLIRWRVRDAQGLTTEVGLLDAKFGTKLNPDLFIFREPADTRPGAGNNWR